MSQMAPLKMNDVGVTWVTHGLVGEDVARAKAQGRGQSCRDRGGEGTDPQGLDSVFTGEHRSARVKGAVGSGRLQMAGRRVAAAFTGPFLVE